MNLKYIQELAQEVMMQRRSHPNVELGNKYFHGLRVANIVTELRQTLFPEHPEWDETLWVAALFHDIANDYTNPELDHQIAGAEMTAGILKDVCLAGEIEQITALIRTHDSRNPGGTATDPEKLLQDADLLDHLGTFDIWYIFSRASSSGMNMLELFDWFEKTRPGKDKRFYDGCHFELSRRLILDKCRFVNDFGRRYMTEAAGRLWNLEEIAAEWKADGSKLYGDVEEEITGRIWE